MRFAHSCPGAGDNADVYPGLSAGFQAVSVDAVRIWTEHLGAWALMEGTV